MIDKAWVENMLELQKLAQGFSQGSKWSNEFLESILQSLQNWGLQPPGAGFQAGDSGSVQDFWTEEAIPSYSQSQKPHINISETGREVNLTALIPGIKHKDDLSVKLHGDYICISGKRTVISNSAPKQETSTALFSRIIRLPVEVESREGTASYRSGMLMIKLVKKDQAGHVLDVDFIS